MEWMMFTFIPTAIAILLEENSLEVVTDTLQMIILAPAVRLARLTQRRREGQELPLYEVLIFGRG